jgi:hypothetical protein
MAEPTDQRGARPANAVCSIGPAGSRISPDAMASIAPSLDVPAAPVQLRWAGFQSNDTLIFGEIEVFKYLRKE